MGDKSRIEWTDATWNPVTGCSKVSPGCAHCYAETLALTRLAGQPGYPGLPWTPENAAANVMLRPERLELPLRWKRPRRIFVNSMSDLFHEFVPDDFVTAVVAVMAAAPQHVFQVLTKRPERMRAWAERMAALPGNGRQITLESAALDLGLDLSCDPEWPLPNVWLGTSVENQHWADVRIPELLATPAAVRFLSCEPLLGPLDLDAWLCPFCHGARWCDDENWTPDDPQTWRGERMPGNGRIPCDSCNLGGWHVAEQKPVPLLNWIIAGGESGPIHRPMDPEWVRDLRDQAQDAGVAFLFKQWGGRTSKAGGRELDGRTWDEYPAVAA